MADIRTAVVTGASGGIGLETARALAVLGFQVLMVCRNPQKADVARTEILTTAPDASLDVVLADLSVMDQVRTAANEINDKLDRLDVLVNNAGVALKKQGTTPEGLDLIVATNHLGPFLLTNLLLPLLVASAPSRIVNVASDAHKFSNLDPDDLGAGPGFDILGLRRYGQTKLMNILFTRELAQRLDGTGVAVNAVHPGAVSTNLGEPPKVLSQLSSRFMKTPAQGAATSVRVATDAALAGVTGGYFMNERQADGKLSRQARDDAAASRLWTTTEQALGYRFVDPTTN